MLPNPNRLPRQAFNSIFKTGKRIHESLYTIVTVQNDLPYSRFAFIVPGSIVKLATDRNHMKRLLRESAHHLLPSIKPEIDCIIIVNRNFSELNQKEIERNIRITLSKMSLLTKTTIPRVHSGQVKQ